MYELKKIGKVFTSKFVGTGPSSFKKRIYRASVSQMLRNTGLTNWVLERIFGTGEREAERYVTGIVCWQQIVLGWLDKGWEGKGREGSGGIVRHLLESLDDESEGKTI